MNVNANINISPYFKKKAQVHTDLYNDEYWKTFKIFFLV